MSNKILKFAPLLQRNFTKTSWVYCSSTSGQNASKQPKATNSNKVKTSKATTSSEKPSSDNSSYRAKEYYAHNEWSFYDIENAIPSRVGQPSSKPSSHPQ